METADDDFEPRVEDENYFVSMTDMMVGLVFVFVILIMYYALQLRQAQAALDATKHQIVSADETRTQILEDVKQRLFKRGLRVEIDVHNGVLRLPDDVLFDSAKADIKPDGVIALRKLGQALLEVLPCYTDVETPVSTEGKCKKPSSHRIESLFIEGHTDDVPLKGVGLMQDNWDLSVMRATNTYRELKTLEPTLDKLCLRHASDCVRILSVSGYGDTRPLSPVPGDDPARAKAKNRRIDLRILMQAPHSDSVEKDVNRRIDLGIPTQSSRSDGGVREWQPQLRLTQ